MLIKGQEVKVSLTSTETGLVTDLSDVESFSFEIGTKILEQALLGETSNRVDEIYEKTTGSMALKHESPGFFDFVAFIAKRAQRRLPAAARIDVSCRFTYSTGQRRLALFRDLKFGPLGTEAGGRDDFIGSTFEWACSEIPRFI